jgi:antitoxin component YwqK of YwqJK toxin-antitoxin module
LKFILIQRILLYKIKDKRQKTKDKSQKSKVKSLIIKINPMKISDSVVVLFLAICIFEGCNGKGKVKKESKEVSDATTVTDTGYTGIKKYLSGKLVVKEVTFKNGVREGLMKSFYQTGEVRQTFWYRNGLREDSAKWYYLEGQLFRSTPYKRDTIDGIQKQYYRTGRLKAKIGYSRGLRTTYLQEFTPEGKLVGGYPELVVNVRDDYKVKGIYGISLELSDKATNVRYWRGELSNGLFDTVRCKRINIIKGIGTLDLKKNGSSKSGYIGVIAEILTNFGNNNLVYKKIALPYNDLK